MDKQLSKMDAQWTCPKCGMVNHDNYFLTARPFCENGWNEAHGFEAFEWDDLLSQDDFDRLNPLLIEYDRALNV